MGKRVSENGFLVLAFSRQSLGFSFPVRFAPGSAPKGCGCVGSCAAPGLLLWGFVRAFGLITKDEEGRRGEKNPVVRHFCSDGCFFFAGFLLCLFVFCSAMGG